MIKFPLLLVMIHVAFFGISQTEDVDNFTTIIDNNGFRFETLTTGINTSYSDYGSCLFRNKFISYSSRKIGAFARQDPITGEPFTNLFCNDILPDWDLERPLLFSYVLNKNENLGTVTFSEDGFTMYFTTNLKGNTQLFQLFKAQMDPVKLGRWENITPVSFNSESYSVENPHLSSDGRTLYFASDMPGSVGGFDIYKVDIMEDGTFGSIVAVEGNINTEKDEKFPHTSPDGKFLYFASNGHPGLGGYDIFKSRRTSEGYRHIVNLGNTLNSTADEVAFIPAQDKLGYFTSNRSGGEGSYDIYRYSESRIEQQVTGKTLDFDTGLPLAGISVKLTDTDGNEVGSIVSDPEGNFHFQVLPFENYTLTGEMDGYQTAIIMFDTDNKTEKFKQDIIIKIIAAEIVTTDEKTYIKIENIQFDFDSAVIKPVSTITLNKVYRTLTENPEMKVAINAHTDNRGNDSYNQRLSLARAKSTVDYLAAKGIALDRMIPSGFGESSPLINCTQCTEEEHELNRRVEFIVMDEAPQIK
jgi:outer membrane protein OmpA-like peptidoglycan-associated protein